MAAPSNAFLITLAVLLSLLHAVMATTATTEKSMTADEIAHLAAGHAYNTRADYRLQPENGNLPQRLAAVPMTVAGVTAPPPTLAAWKIANVWHYGHAFFYERPVLVDEWLFLGRAMIALVSAATGLLVFFWSRMLFGWRGGFLSLALFVFSPTFLAHGALTTSDVVMTFFFVAALGAWWRHLDQPGFRWATVSALTLGVAFVAKFSVVLLPPMLAVVGIAWLVRERVKSGWRRPCLRLLRTTLVHVATAWAVIWLFYGFRYSAFAPSFAAGADFNYGWDWTLTGVGKPAMVIRWMKDWHILPEAWLYGLTFVLKFSLARGAFMSGEYSITGWATFFPFAFLVKSTLPLLLLVSGGVIALAARIRKVTRGGAPFPFERVLPFVPLAALFLIYWITSLTSHLNIGHRHILPTYPVLFIAVGWLGQWLDVRRPVAALCITGLVLWHAVESLVVRPHYLAYFNQVVGGPSNGWRHLVDSSLDWGQDLPGLSRWLQQHAKGEKVFLSYFGTGDPGYEGIRATMLPTLPEVGPPRPWHELRPGVYAVSATMLQHVYSKVRGAWTLELEKEYQQLRAIEPTLLAYQNDPSRRAELLRDVAEDKWDNAWKRYEQLRFARLCHYLRVRDPDAVIGYSMFVFRLTPAELEGAVGESLNGWRRLIEQAVEQRHASVILGR